MELEQFVKNILALAEPTVIVAFLGLLARFLASPAAKDAVKALGDKLAAEAESLIAAADHTNNILIEQAVHAAIIYAENHQADIEKEFGSKLDFVVHQIQSNPRFAPLGVSALELEMLVEQLLATVLSDLAHPAAAPIKPADVPGGGPGHP